LGGVQLRRAVDGLGLELGGAVGVGVVELIDGAVFIVLQTPGGGEIDNADAMRESDRSEIARLLVRQREEEHVDAFLLESLPGEGNDQGGVGVGCTEERRMDVDEAQGLFGALAAQEDRRRGEARMVQEDARELGPGITGDARDGNAQRIG
jgi:hypothetical protein